MILDSLVDYLISLVIATVTAVR